MGYSPLENLEPRSVWAHFATLCAIPRPSLHEAALRAHLLEWARMGGIEAVVDAAGNLILRKPASPGAEAAPGVILQGHLDMVCQKNTGVLHDFHRDPIQAELKDGWLVAEHTTLGADNGVGVALALAALQADDLQHPALEVLLTVNEESGMDGARALRPGTLRGRRLINLDTEEWGHFYLGCAGGVDVEVVRPCRLEPLPADLVVWRVAVSGLLGGHSGIDIHRDRGNAIKLLVAFLLEACRSLDIRLLSLEGGSARNAIPREAHADLALPAAAAERLRQLVAETQAEWRRRYADRDPDVSLGCQPVEPEDNQALCPDDRKSLLGFLHTTPNGVRQMSRDFPGVVDSSDNLGVIQLKNGICRAVFMVRGLSDCSTEKLADTIALHAEAHHAIASQTGAYPGWTPDPRSSLLAHCQRAYGRLFGAEAQLQVIHAGLECGLIAASHPHLEMISFGPDIQGAHAPGERVSVESVVRCWALLRAVLAELAGPEA